MLTLKHKVLLSISVLVIALELGLIVIYWPTVIDWLSHNLWVVVIPFAKVIVKKLITMKFFALLQAVWLLLWHLSKLLLLKILKTLGMRYGVFFSQRRWYWARWLKVMFLRRGKQFFRVTTIRLAAIIMEVVDTTSNSHFLFGYLLVAH